MDEMQTNNRVILCGTPLSSPVFSHASRLEPFYTFPLEVARLSGTVDTINVLLREELLPELKPSRAGLIRIAGEVRSFNNHSGEGSKLVISVFARELSPPETPVWVNEVELTGTLCKSPNRRTTPMGREICDLMLAVNRLYGRSDYLPCIVWGQNARRAALWDAYSPGRLDQHLYPFYEHDVEAGILDDEKALELLECLWVKFNNQPAPPKVGITLKESSTYTDFANINTGGITPDGHDGVNDVSYLILDCMDEMKLLQPSSNVQISKKTPQRFLKRACEISRKGWGQPAFYNTDAIIQELLNAGKSIEDARRGGTSGCVETGAFGNEAYILTGYFNLPKILEITLHNGFDPVSNKQLGLKLGNAEDFKSYDELFEAYKKQVRHFADIKIRGNNVIEKIYKEYMPAPFLSIITNDCISKGKDYNGGGARYNTSYIQGVGIGTITDSLAAIKYNVFEQHRFTMHELMEALDHNFEGYPEIYNFVANKTPKYGNDDDYADEIMESVFDYYYHTVSGRPNVRGGTYRINMLPTTCHVYFGEVMLASPNGRLAHKPVSEGISPEKGADVHGPTAVIKSCSKMDHLRTGGTLLNQKFTPSVVAGEEGLDNMANLVRSYFSMDGHHIQFNVIDRQTLIDAQNNPEEYKDLIVRVAGYSDHFRNLSRALQDEIIARTEQSFN